MSKHTEWLVFLKYYMRPLKDTSAEPEIYYPTVLKVQIIVQ